MIYEMLANELELLVNDLGDDASPPLINQRYSKVARDLTAVMREDANKERDRVLKRDLITFVLRWYKTIVKVDDPPFALAEFLSSARAAGYDYDEWNAVMKSIPAYEEELRGRGLIP
jgi:hypothetical protein